MSFMVDAENAILLNEVLWSEGFRYGGLSHTRWTGEHIPCLLYERRADTTEVLIYFDKQDFLIDAVYRNEEEEEETNFELLSEIKDTLRAKGVEVRRGV